MNQPLTDTGKRRKTLLLAAAIILAVILIAGMVLAPRPELRARIRGMLSGATTAVCQIAPMVDCSGADFTGANLAGKDLHGATLTRANLSGADLTGTDLREAVLNEADLSGANLSYANLSGAKLGMAKLAGAQLEKARITSANLIRADLTRADLTAADMRQALLRGATLSYANLYHTDLTNADMDGALSEGAVVCATIMPDGRRGYGNCSVPSALPDSWTAEQTLHYTLFSAVGSCLAGSADFSTRIGICNGSPGAWDQQWEIRAWEGAPDRSWVLIANRLTGWCLQSPANSTAPEATIGINQCSNSNPSQLWHLEAQSETDYLLVNQYDGQCLRTPALADGTAVVPGDCNADPDAIAPERPTWQLSLVGE